MPRIVSTLITLGVVLVAGLVFGVIKPGDLQRWLPTDEPAVPVENGLPPVGRQGETIRIATYNIQVFGESKLANEPAMQVLVDVCRRFDVIAIQEIRARSQEILPQFVQRLNAAGRHYDFVISERLGRTTSKEQYAFVYDRASVEIDPASVYVIDDPDDLLHRAPFVAGFRVRGPPPGEAFTFTLINIHTDPDEVAEEIDVLDDVIRSVRSDGRGEDDVILLGDLNADYRKFGQLGQMPNIAWVIHDFPTNTRRTATYDNILFDRRATVEFTGRAGVLDVMQTYNLTMEQALQVSDHLPVWAEFSITEGGQAGLMAGQAALPRQ